MFIEHAIITSFAIIIISANVYRAFPRQNAIVVMKR